MNLRIVLILFCGVVSTFDYKIKNLDECSTSGKSSTVLKCKADESSTVLILQINFTEKITKMNVSFAFNFFFQPMHLSYF